eukprot:m.483503 g.483503  ORF g.483503 m.483503 type:complete len:365 (+) comp22971_c0_seq1:178-1272(+)
MQGAMSFATLVLAVAMVVPAPASAWWDTGHVLTAEIAAQTLLSLGLDQHVSEVRDALSLEHNMFPDTSEVPYAATWSDEIKDSTETMNSWHFVDFPYNPEKRQVPDLPETNAVFILTELNETITPGNAKMHKKYLSKAASWGMSFAVRWLLHLMGDIHQPLHCVSLYNSHFPSGDRGGNFYHITYPPNKDITNLHSLFDSVGGLFTGYMPRPVDKDYMKMIEDTGKQLMQEFPRSMFTNLTHLTETIDYYRWSRESHNLSITAGYNAIPPNSVVNDTQIATLRQILKRQLVLGGYRLANVLKQTHLPLRGPRPSTKYSSPLPWIAILGIGVGGGVLLVVLTMLVARRKPKHHYTVIPDSSNIQF